MPITPLDDPQPWIGCYGLDLYCKYDNPAHGFREFPHCFGSFRETGAQARRDARAAGWLIHKDHTATCPKCAKELEKGALRHKSRHTAGDPTR